MIRLGLGTSQKAGTVSWAASGRRRRKRRRRRDKHGGRHVDIGSKPDAGQRPRDTDKRGERGRCLTMPTGYMTGFHAPVRRLNANGLVGLAKYVRRSCPQHTPLLLGAYTHTHSHSFSLSLSLSLAAVIGQLHRCNVWLAMRLVVCSGGWVAMGAVDGAESAILTSSPPPRSPKVSRSSTQIISDPGD